MRDHARRVGGRTALIAARQFPTPACYTIAARLYGDRRLALPCIVFIQHFAANFGRAMDDENEPWQWRQLECDVFCAGQNVLVKSKHWMHSQLPTVIEQ